MKHRQKFAAGVGPSWRTSSRAVRKGNIGSASPHRVPSGVLPSGAVGRGSPSSRPQNGRSTNSLNRVPRKAADIECQPVKPAGKKAISCKVTGAELSKTMGTHLLHQCDLDVRPAVNGDNIGALKFDCPAGSWTCMGSATPLFWPISPIWNGCVYPLLAPPLYLGSN